jgi:hypothetical protein
VFAFGEYQCVYKTLPILQGAMEYYIKTKDNTVRQTPVEHAPAMTVARQFTEQTTPQPQRGRPLF